MRIPFWIVLVAGGVIVAAALFTRTIPYWLVLPLAVGWLAAQHAGSPATSERSKQGVVLATVWATAAASAWPLVHTPALLVLVGVGVYVLLHHDVMTPSA
jgi:hypothetical protein